VKVKRFSQILLIFSNWDTTSLFGRLSQETLYQCLVGEKRGLDFERALICILTDERFLRVLKYAISRGHRSSSHEEIIGPLKAEFEE